MEALVTTIVLTSTDPPPPQTHTHIHTQHTHSIMPGWIKRAAVGGWLDLLGGWTPGATIVGQLDWGSNCPARRMDSLGWIHPPLKTSIAPPSKVLSAANFRYVAIKLELIIMSLVKWRHSNYILIIGAYPRTNSLPSNLTLLMAPEYTGPRLGLLMFNYDSINVCCP